MEGGSLLSYLFDIIFLIFIELADINTIRTTLEGYIMIVRTLITISILAALTISICLLVTKETHIRLAITAIGLAVMLLAFEQKAFNKDLQIARQQQYSDLS